MPSSTTTPLPRDDDWTGRRNGPSLPQVSRGDPHDVAIGARILQDAAMLVDVNFGCPVPKVAKEWFRRCFCLEDPDMAREVLMRQGRQWSSADDKDPDRLARRNKSVDPTGQRTAEMCG